ncbi:MAG: hypothetical protein NW226_03945 [Microscillaceae bacterium]|nr:hypothetical protein [Microscillaceae bacterium]
MPTNLITSDNFRREAKRLLKKYKSLKGELLELQDQLLENPEMGTALGYQAYKIRLAVQSKGKGKRGGLRVITYVEIVIQVEPDEEYIHNIVLPSIYDKSEYETIEDQHLKQLIEDIKRNNQD